MGATLKLQLGITLHKARYVKALHKLKEGLALPIAWVHLVSLSHCSLVSLLEEKIAFKCTVCAKQHLRLLK